MKINDQSEKIRIFIGFLEQDPQLPDYVTFKNHFDGIIEIFIKLYTTKESNASPIMDSLQIYFRDTSLFESSLRSSESSYIKHDLNLKAQIVIKL